MVFFTRRFLPVTGTSIGNIDEGTIITLNESASPVEFYVAKQDYESGLNGAPGGPWWSARMCMTSGNGTDPT